MSLLDRYIFKSSLWVCAAAVGLFAFLLMIGNFVRDLIPPLMAGQLSSVEIVRLVLLLIPFVASYALPMGILTGVLLTLGRLSADNEITAMRAAGVSVARLARPVLILGALGAVLGLRVNFESMPWARVQYEKEFTAAVRTNPLSFIVARTFIRDFPGFVVYVGDKHGSVMKDFWLWQLDSSRRVVRLVRAADGRFDYNEATNEFVLTLSQAQVETRDEKNPEDFTAAEPVGTFEKWDEVRLPLNKIFKQGGVRQKLRWMTLAELRARQASLAREKTPAGGEKDRARAEMDVAFVIQEKFNTAIAVLSFALIGVPLGVKISRRETTANLGVAVGLALGYYFLNVAIGWLDQRPEFRPDLLLWLPNVAFVALAAMLFWRLDRSPR